MSETGGAGQGTPPRPVQDGASGPAETPGEPGASPPPAPGSPYLTQDAMRVQYQLIGDESRLTNSRPVSLPPGIEVSQEIIEIMTAVRKDLQTLAHYGGADHEATWKLLSLLPPETQEGWRTLRCYLELGTVEPGQPPGLLASVPYGPARIDEFFGNDDRTVRHVQESLTWVAEMAGRCTKAYVGHFRMARENWETGRRNLDTLLVKEATTALKLFQALIVFTSPVAMSLKVYVNAKHAFECLKLALGEAFTVVKARINLELHIVNATFCYRNRGFPIIRADLAKLKHKLTVWHKLELLKVNLVPAGELTAFINRVRRLADDIDGRIRNALVVLEQMQEERSPAPAEVAGELTDICNQMVNDLLLNQPDLAGVNLMKYTGEQQIVFRERDPTDRPAIEAHRMLVELVDRCGDPARRVMSRVLRGYANCRLSTQAAHDALGTIRTDTDILLQPAGNLAWVASAELQLAELNEIETNLRRELTDQQREGQDGSSANDSVIAEYEQKVENHFRLNRGHIELRSDYVDVEVANRVCDGCNRAPDPARADGLATSLWCLACARPWQFSQIRAPAEGGAMVRPGSIPELLGGGDDDGDGEEEDQNDDQATRDPLSLTGASPVELAAHVQSVLDLADEMDTPQDDRDDESTDNDAGSTDDGNTDIESILSDPPRSPQVLDIPDVITMPPPIHSTPLPPSFPTRGASGMRGIRVDVQVHQPQDTQLVPLGRDRERLSPLMSSTSARPVGGQDTPLHGHGPGSGHVFITKEFLSRCLAEVPSFKIDFVGDVLGTGVPSMLLTPRSSREASPELSWDSWGLRTTHRSAEPGEEAWSGHHLSYSGESPASSPPGFSFRPIDPDNSQPAPSRDSLSYLDHRLPGYRPPEAMQYRGDRHQTIRGGRASGGVTQNGHDQNHQNLRAPGHRQEMAGSRQGQDFKERSASPGRVRELPPRRQPSGGGGGGGGLPPGGGSGGGGRRPPGGGTKPPGGGGRTGKPPTPPSSSSSSSGDDDNERSLSRDIDEAMNSSRPGESLNMSPKQLKHLKLLQSLALELQYMRDQILKKLRHKKLGDYSPEDQNLSLNPVIQGLSGRTVTTIQRLEDDSIRLLKYCNRAMVSPECANLHVRARVEQSVRPLIRHLRLLTCNLTTILTAYRTHQSRRSQQERSALRECADLLVYQTPEWTGPQGQSYIFYMQKFLSAQEFIPNKSAKFLNLKRAMKKVPRAVAVVSYYDGSTGKRGNALAY